MLSDDVYLETTGTRSKTHYLIYPLAGFKTKFSFYGIDYKYSHLPVNELYLHKNDSLMIQVDRVDSLVMSYNKLPDYKDVEPEQIRVYNVGVNGRLCMDIDRRNALKTEEHKFRMNLFLSMVVLNILMIPFYNFLKNRL